jgi:predicted SPOUT superfamily RNA methylase MTH1
MRRLNLEVVPQGSLYALTTKSNLYDRIVTAQRNDEDIQTIKQKLAERDPKYTCFQKDHQDVVWFGKRLVVPVDPEIKKIILDEAHQSKFSIHPGSTKMYQDLKKNFWWSNKKVDIAKYVTECDTCHRMKASHLKLAGVLQPLSIPMWKWDDISMDFIAGLPLTARKKYSIWVIVDRLTKTAHFIAVHTTYSVQQYAELYMDHIVCLHGIPKTIISDRGTQFVARF